MRASLVVSMVAHASVLAMAVTRSPQRPPARRPPITMVVDAVPLFIEDVGGEDAGDRESMPQAPRRVEVRRDEAATPNEPTEAPAATEMPAAPEPESAPLEEPMATGSSTAESTESSSHATGASGDEGRGSSTGTGSTGDDGAGGVVTRAARLRAPVDPARHYPDEARRRRIEGRTTFVFTLDVSGEIVVTTIESSTPPGVFERAARSLAAELRYWPATIDGVPVASRARLVVTWRR